VKLGRTASDTCTVLFEAYGGEAMKNSSVFEWHKWFREGHENMDNDERSCLPRSPRTDEDAEKVQNLVHSDKHLSIRNVAMLLNLDKQ
jgi:hypothetical protein